MTANWLNKILNGLFTIQNVPIKLLVKALEQKKYTNLQYKMFLLNESSDIGRLYSLVIYNTKCSY